MLNYIVMAKIGKYFLFEIAKCSYPNNIVSTGEQEGQDLRIINIFCCLTIRKH